MFLVRPRPQLGESLSSWRQRSGMENGFRLFPTAPGELRRLDPDLSPSASTLEWLARSFDIRPHALQALSLRSMADALLTFGKGRACPRWVVPLHYSRRDESFGTPFCPECLRLDVKPFFRLSWRLALSSICVAHGAILQERCTRCAMPTWPASALAAKTFRDSWSPLYICAECGFDLRCAPRSPVHSCASIELRLEPFASDIRMSSELTVPASEYAAALWSLCQLFVRARSKRLILAAGTEWSSVSLAIDGRHRRGPALLPILERHLLVSSGHKLLENWPDSFLEFSVRSGISAEHFSSDRNSLPSWLGRVISAHLAKQVRGIGPDQVSAARLTLANGGQPVNKAGVERLLGVTDGKFIQDALNRRFKGTTDEALELLLRLQLHMQDAATRLSTSEMRYRDVSMILCSITSGVSLAVVAAWSHEELEVAVAGYLYRDDLSALVTRTRDLLRQATTSYRLRRENRSRKRKSNNAGEAFESFRAGAVPSRSAQETLRACMRSLDPRLFRSTSAFFDLS